MQEITRFFNIPENSFFLFGPRGTGKSTLIKSRFPNALRIDLLKPDVLRSYDSFPERLYKTIEAHPGSPVIVLDEIQRVPDLLSIVHDIIEQKKGLQFILTGSSSRKLKRAGVDLLGGRALNCSLYPFMAAELGSLFSLNDALEFGLLPLLFDKKNPQTILDGYVSLYLDEEVKAEGFVRNVGNFSRFLEIISFSHGSILNVTNIARECEVKRTTVENYIKILEDLLLAYQLPIFSKRAQRQLAGHPKFYIFDAGVFRALRPRGPLDRVEESEGAALEGLVLQHLKAWDSYSRDKHTLGFWRTRSGVEVDFVVYGPKYFWGIEVKNSKRINPADTRSLEIFLTEYPMAKVILLYRGTEYIKIKNVLCVPCEDFLKQLRPDQDIWPEK